MGNYFSAATAVAIAGALAGCAIDVPTDPQTFNLEPASMSQLRESQQAVALKNGYQSENKQQFKVGPHTWIVDARGLTDTAIAMLGRGLEKRGLKPAPQAEKTVTLRVVAHSASVQSYPGFAQTRVRVALDALCGDGTRVLTNADNMSPSGAQRAFDGAVLFALNRLLADEKFLAYMNR